MDTRVSFSSNNPNVCLYCYNLVPSEYSLRVRDGYREWQIDIDGVVGTIIPFDGQDDTLIDNKLFVVTNMGIFDVTIVGETPILKIAFNDNSNDAGYGTFTIYLTDGGDQFIYYADSRNGLYRYSAELDAWVKMTDADITGVTPGVDSINFVVVHKLRIWFGTSNSGIAWYLAPNAIQGLAESFNFGVKFKHGGNLVGLYNWTVDGGDGINDFLIGVSRAGDVLPYIGSDPTQDDWQLVGTYFIGQMAKGHRAASQYGGNTAFLSTFGITEMSDLLRGVDPQLGSTAGKDSLGAKISPLIRTDMRTYKDDNGWDIRYLQTEGVIIVTTPRRLNGEYLQYVYNVSVDGWGIWRGPPITCVDVWNGFVYFGTTEGKVMVMDVTKDNVLLNPPEGTINGELIEFSMLHSYLDMDDPSIQKRGKFIRPDFLAKQPPNYASKFLYDYSIFEINGIPPAVNGTSDALWNISFWDEAIWSSDVFLHFDRVIGGAGIGRYLSVAIKGKALSQTSLMSTDVTWDAGGFL